DDEHRRERGEHDHKLELFVGREVLHGRPTINRRARFATRTGPVVVPTWCRLRGVGEVFVLRELPQSLGLDLTDAFARQAELLADRLERGGAVTDEPEAELDHVALAVRQVGDRLANGQIAERG